jgi:hypothetical protein
LANAPTERKGYIVVNMDLNTPTKTRAKRARANEPGIPKQPQPGTTAEILPKPKRVKLAIDREAIKKIKLVAVAYSNIERELVVVGRL